MFLDLKRMLLRESYKNRRQEPTISKRSIRGLVSDSFILKQSVTLYNVQHPPLEGAGGGPTTKFGCNMNFIAIDK